MVRLILIFLLIAIVNSTFWMNKEFGEVYPYEFFYHLFFGLNEFTEINQDYFFSFIQNGFILPVCSSVLIYLIIKFINNVLTIVFVVFHHFNLTRFCLYHAALLFFTIVTIRLFSLYVFIVYFEPIIREIYISSIFRNILTF